MRRPGRSTKPFVTECKNFRLAALTAVYFVAASNRSRNMPNTRTVSPLSIEQQEQVLQQTTYYVQHAAEIFQRRFSVIPVSFDLRGRAAGMYRVRQGQRLIRYNSHIFAKYFHENLQETVAHEVAHYISDVVYGLQRIRPHGQEWQSIMQAFGVSPRRAADFDLSGIPLRRQRRFTYRCDCRDYALSTVRHNRVQAGNGFYVCRECGSRLNFAGHN